ncbi:MAG: tetratricopeptide repeat protein [Campylobacterota bacterium]
MLDIRDLERRWLKYKLKRYLPYAAVALIVLGGVVMALFPTREGSHALSSIGESNGSERSASAPSASADHNTTVLEPSMRFVETFQGSLAAQPAAAARLPVQSSLPPPKILEMPEPPQIVPGSPKPATASAQGGRSLLINRNENKADIEELQNRFKETSNANLGLYIAKYHYDRGNYAEAYNYALKTNAINSRIEESWLLFSKALVKLGRTEQAKKTLQLYVQQSDSDAAKALLNSIEKGTFK